MISKLMVKDEANAEVDEYKVLQRIDRQNKYYPGPPEKCDVNPNDKNISENDCSLLEDKPDLNDYSLLIYKDGGIDLDDFVEDHLDDYLKHGKQKQTDLFWLNAHKLFKGLRLYINNGFLHHDIKPSNIVFDPKTHSFNFIDFGLSVLTNNLVKDILNKKDYESFHWSYPLEVGFTNYKKDFHFDKLDKAKIDKVERDFIRLFTQDDNIKNDYKIKPKRYTHTTFRYMINQLSVADIPNIIKASMDGIRYYKESENFEKFVNDTVPYLDIYALGFTLNHVLNFFYIKNAVTGEEYARLSALFRSMFEFDFTKRLKDINMILSKYEEILKTIGVLKRLGKSIENHEIVDLKKSSSTVKVCPNGKKLNRKTNRCKRIIK
jgi:serine/threonine protein kinase